MLLLVANLPDWMGVREHVESDERLCPCRLVSRRKTALSKCGKLQSARLARLGNEVSVVLSKAKAYAVIPNVAGLFALTRRRMPVLVFRSDGCDREEQ